jgi:putative ATP-dependent endonuclease of the OLD family
MRLCKFEIHNYKGIHAASFSWEDIVILIGENNAGKSTVLQALQCFLGGSQVKDPAIFSQNVSNVENALELIGHFSELSEAEQQAPAVRGRMLDDKWILKKKFWSEVEDDNEVVWKEQYYSYSSSETFANWPEADGAWANFPQEYQRLIDLVAGRGPRPNNQTREQLRDLVRQHQPEMVGLGEPTWISNPGGGGNWKSNANSIVPRWVYVKAVHDASEESISKEASSYGKIVNLIVEKRFVRRPEIIELRRGIDAVLRLFSPDPDHPEVQAQEIRDVEDRINARLNQVIAGTVAIRTSEVEIEPILLPSTHLVLKDRPGSVETAPGHQGNGLQRTLVMTLLQILAEIQSEPAPNGEHENPQPVLSRAVILAVEEPELYMHPQMERKMRDVLYRLSAQPNFQVICTTHSPAFLDVGKSHKTLVRVVKDEYRVVRFFQVKEDIFPMVDAEEERKRLKLIAAFNPTVNELFFARSVVLLEENSALIAIQRGAELAGIFDRHPHLRRDVTLIDCDGKGNIPMFQKVLNHFEISYTVLHDEDRGNRLEEASNERIAGLLAAPNWHNLCYVIRPTNLEQLLGYAASKDKPYRALKRVEELHAAGAVPAAFREALNWAYFGQAAEPGL